MLKCKLTVVLALGLAVMLSGFTGCAGKKKAPEPEKKVIKAPEKKPAPTPVIKETPRKTEEKITVPEDLRLSTIYFDFDKSNIRSDQRGTLRSNAELLAEYETVKILIEGHCDERGTNEYNLALGQRRSESTKRYLVDYGISISRIETVSYGEERPVDTGHNESAWSKNRRGEFIITAK